FFLRALYPKEPSLALVEFLQARFKNIKVKGVTLQSPTGVADRDQPAVGAATSHRQALTRVALANRGDAHKGDARR
ncbi:hypothetical protein GW17_00056100, partial [Ensete ventricosum]